MLTAIDPTFGGKLTPPPLSVRAELAALDARMQHNYTSHRNSALGSPHHQQNSPQQQSAASPVKKRSVVAETVPEEASLTVLVDNSNEEPTAMGCRRVSPRHPTAERLSTSSATTTDSALSSTNDSRRGSSNNGSSFGFGSHNIGGVETGVIRPRRSTVTGRLPNSRRAPPILGGALANGHPPPISAAWRTISADSQFDDENLSENEEDDDGEMVAIDMRAIRRRMSVDEKTLRNANYAILRKSENYFQLVGAFNRHEASAYRNYLQSITAYDILPAHGIVLMMCNRLSIRKTIHALCSQNCTKAAITTEPKTGNYNIFTISDALHCLQLKRKDRNVADQSLQDYFDAHQPQKRLVVTGDITSVWDVSRLFRMNHVHRIPVVKVENFVRTKEVMGVVSLRPIFIEIAKLFEKSFNLTPNLHRLTLAATGLGKRKGLATINEKAPCADAVDQFLEKKISCLPLVNDEGHITGALTKSDIMNAIAVRGESAIDEIMDASVSSIANPLNLVEMLVGVEASLASAIRQLVANHHQCLLIAHEGKMLLGVLSYADIMDFLVGFDRVPSNGSGGSSTGEDI